MVSNGANLVTQYERVNLTAAQEYYMAAVVLQQQAMHHTHRGLKLLQTLRRWSGTSDLTSQTL